MTRQRSAGASSSIGPILLTPNDTSPVQPPPPPMPDLSFKWCRWCWPTYEPHTEALHAVELDRAKRRIKPKTLHNPTDQDLIVGWRG